MLTKKELAEYLKLSIPTIDRYMAAGMPCLKLHTGTVRFELDAVIDWFKGKEVNE